MKFQDPDHKFTRFKLYLDYDFGQLANNKAIMDGLQKWGEMSPEQARSYLMPGSGPTIVFGEVNKRSILDNDFPFSVTLPEIMVKTFEDTSGKGESNFFKTGNGRRVQRIGLSLLHRIIEGHLLKFHPDDAGDKPSGFAKMHSRVFGFERDVFGDVFVSE
jgi:hypothetical protein